MAMMNPFVTMFQEAIGRRYTGRMVASPRGRATLLAFMADAEESDEQRVFDRLLERVDDPALHKLVRKHRDDEVRHAALLRGASASVGARPEPIPDELRIVLRIDRKLGGAAAAFVSGQTGIFDAYALLQVIEERAVREFPGIARALRSVDPSSAEVVEQVLADERRHVMYAQAVNRRYAASPEALERGLARMRAVEAAAFAEHEQAFLRFAVERELLAVGAVERRFWQALVRTEPHAALAVAT